jgi:8-oxo-dGTP pyrophosphatase MutT (NUDIX family)
MTKPEFEIPEHRLPPGFVDTLGEIPANPVAARPAATVVLLRGGPNGLEVLLLRRTRSAGFVPGAYVFPGGRVDSSEADPEVLKRLSGMTSEVAAGRLELFVGDTPAVAYYLAALREAFEETGILVAIDGRRQPIPSAAADAGLARLQDALLAERVTFERVLHEAHARLDGAAVEYIAHWITPVIEARRYDTRFFAAEVPPGTGFRLSPKEMTDGIWITPEGALDRQKEGSMPMVFPTIKTLQDLAGYDTPFDALRSFRARKIREILPKLVRTPTGVGMELP